MSHKDVGGRRLKLRVALGRTLRGLPLMWRGAAGVLGLCALVWLTPIIAAPAGWAAWLWGVAAFAISLSAVGALARLSISDTVQEARGLGLGPFGLQMGKPEARLVGAALLCLLFLSMIVVILGLVVLAIFGMAELNVQAIQARDWVSVGAPWKLGVLAVLGVGALVIPLLLIVRLSLFAPATLGRRQMVSLNSMGIAYGSFWSILGGLVVMALPKIALLFMTGNGLLGGTAAHVAWVAVMVGLQLPLTLGFLGAAYRQLEYWFPEGTKR